MRKHKLYIPVLEKPDGDGIDILSVQNAKQELSRT